MSGANRPAGSIQFNGPSSSWTSITSCNAGPGTGSHSHVIGYRARIKLENPLITSDSVILLTVEPEVIGPSGQTLAYAAHVESHQPGGADLIVSVIGTPSGSTSCPAPSGASAAIVVNYLIINNTP